MLAEEHVRSAQKRSAIKIKVTVPITIGGYTGQRDQWEEASHDMQVTGDRRNLILVGSGSFSRKIILSIDDLEAALAALDNLHPGGPDRVGW